MKNFIKHFIRYALGWIIISFLFDKFIDGASPPRLEFIRAIIFALIMTIGELSYRSFFTGKKKSVKPK